MRPASCRRAGRRDGASCPARASDALCLMSANRRTRAHDGRAHAPDLPLADHLQLETDASARGGAARANFASSPASLSCTSSTLLQGARRAQHVTTITQTCIRAAPGQRGAWKLHTIHTKLTLGTGQEWKRGCVRVREPVASSPGPRFVPQYATMRLQRSLPRCTECVTRYVCTPGSHVD